MISNKCMYALKAILALARHEGGGPQTIGQIAEAQQIPSRFLEAILRELKQNGFAESQRGKEGGYILARPAAEITVGQILRAFEGPLASGPTSPAADVFAPLWAEAESALSSVFDAANFRQLVDREDDLRRQSSSNYTI